jgi:hypothetical protein
MEFSSFELGRSRQFSRAILDVLEVICQSLLMIVVDIYDRILRFCPSGEPAGRLVTARLNAH